MSEQAKPIFDVTVGQGKYRFMQDEKYKSHVFRNGHRWEAYDVNSPDNLHVALATDLYELQQERAHNVKQEDKAAVLLHELRLLIDTLPAVQDSLHGEPFDAQLMVQSATLAKLHALVAPLKDIVHPDPTYGYGRITQQGIDKDGKEVFRGSRTSLNPQRDHHLMDSFLLLNEAYELRDVPLEETQLGSMLIRPAANKDPKRPNAQIEVRIAKDRPTSSSGHFELKYDLTQTKLKE